MPPFLMMMSYFYLPEFVANVDDILGEIFLEEREPTEQELKVNQFTYFCFVDYSILSFMQIKLHQNIGRWFAYLNAFLSWYRFMFSC